MPLPHGAHEMSGLVRWRATDSVNIPPAYDQFSGPYQENWSGPLQTYPTSSKTVKLFTQECLHPPSKIHRQWLLQPPTELLQPTLQLGRRISCRSPRSLLYPFTGFRCHFTVRKLHGHRPWPHSSSQASQSYRSPVPDATFQSFSPCWHPSIYLEIRRYREKYDVTMI